MPLRVSLVNLQKFTFHGCGDAASIRMLAPAQKIFSLPLVTTTVAHLGVLEAQPLHGVVELDVHAEVVGVQLQLVARDQAALLVDVHGQGGDRAVDGEPPVPVLPGMRAEVHSGLAGHDHPSAGPQIPSMFYVRWRLRQHP